MTTNSDRFKYADPQDPWAIIPTPWGEMEAWRASAMATGTMGALQNVFEIVRADSAAQAARADATEARNALIEHVCDKIADFEKRFEALEARFAAAEDARRADAARQAKLDEEPLTLPPDISEYQSRTPAAVIGDDDDDTHHPTGELHSLDPKEEPEDPELEDPELELEDSDNIGDLPPELVEEPDPVPEPKGSVLPQPTALFGS
jgi:hypothetical protein